MILGMTVYQLFWFFVIYSFIGWIVEVIFHAVTLGKVINRGFLNGPVCPVYGFGVISVFAVIFGMGITGIPVNDITVFLFGALLATSVELIAGWMLDMCFHARWWDYSDKPFNLHGYICLEFSILWGMGVLLIVRVFHVYVDTHVVARIPEKIGWVILAVLYASYIADVLVTVAFVRGLNEKLSQLDQIRSDMRIVSDRMSDLVGTKTIETAQRIEEDKVQMALAKAEFRDALDERKTEFRDALDERKTEFRDALDERKTEFRGALDERKTEFRKRVSAMEEKKNGLQERLSVIEEKGSELYGRMASQGGDRLEDLQEQYANLQKRFDELAGTLTRHSFGGPAHLLHAFPKMKHRHYQDIVSALRRKLK